MSKKLFYLNCILSLSSITLNLSATDKKFVIVIPSYKNAKVYKKNLDSAICQKYDKTKFRIVYIDDASPDNTADLVQGYIISKQATDIFTLRKNRVRRGAMANLWSEINLCDPNEIVVMLDGDDSLKDEYVLEYLNKVYSENNIWLTYGQYECDPIEKCEKGFAAEYSKEIIQNRDFRKEFLATHLRTFYSWVFQNIKLQDFIYDDSFLPMTWDVAIMFPALEMCGDKFKCISKILYKYNMDNPISDFKLDNNLMFQIADYYKTKKPKYPQLYEPTFINKNERYNNPAAIYFTYGVDKFLSPGFDIDQKDLKGRTPLMHAIKFENQSLIDFLLYKKADVNEADNDGLTPLMYAAIYSNIQTFKLILEKKADLNKVDSFGYDALKYSIKYNNHQIKEFIENLKKSKTIEYKYEYDKYRDNIYKNTYNKHHADYLNFLKQSNEN